jgi:hypothetical protein
MRIRFVLQTLQKTEALIYIREIFYCYQSLCRIHVSLDFVNTEFHGFLY